MIIDAIAGLCPMMHMRAVARAVGIDVATREILMNWDIAAGNTSQTDRRRRGRGNNRVAVRQARRCCRPYARSGGVGGH